ncbi:MAG: histidine kinase [Comamonas sp.]|jgi:NO-binding membrane sensor protein with MHYT domain|nr:histidine kinase [Comamonas sp.]
MDAAVNTSYNMELVVLSYLISAVGAFMALVSAKRLLSGKSASQSYRLGLLSTGIALGGIGVWSMHFIAMLALRMDLGVGYSIWETGISLIAAVLISALAFHIVARNPHNMGRLLTAGSMLGMGAVVMHYLGMYGMRFGGHFQWDYGRVALSVLIALAAATTALWLAFHTVQVSARLLAAAIMAIAVCAMHYTGMSAAEFICTTNTPLAIPGGSSIVSALGLPLVVVALAFGMSLFLILDLLRASFQRYQRPA